MNTNKDIIFAHVNNITNRIYPCNFYYSENGRKERCMLEKNLKGNCRLYHHGCRYMPLYKKYIHIYQRRERDEEVMKMYEEKIREKVEGKKKKIKDLEKKVL